MRIIGDLAGDGLWGCVGIGDGIRHVHGHQSVRDKGWLRSQVLLLVTDVNKSKHITRLIPGNSR